MIFSAPITVSGVRKPLVTFVQLYIDISCLTLGEEGYGSGIVGHDRLVLVVHHLALVVINSAVQDCVRHSGGVAKLEKKDVLLRVFD